MGLLAFFLKSLVAVAFAGNLALIGEIPGEYIAADENKTYTGVVLIEDGKIKKVVKLDSLRLNSVDPDIENYQILELWNPRTRSLDVIYPGLIDLHNHAKQNMVPVWADAKGQFSNRFEWRALDNYRDAVSNNVNIWINAGSPMTCAAYRWNELQALTLGTTYLQGSRGCTDDFAVHQAEEVRNYGSAAMDLAAPTDLIVPNDMIFVWQTLRPLIHSGLTYGQALYKTLKQYCPAITGITVDNINSDEGVELLSDKDWLLDQCKVVSEADEDALPEKFIRYISWAHKTVAGKIQYMNDPNHSAFIFHLGEGRRDDPYNQIEFEILELFGLARPHVSMVHGLGLTEEQMVRAIDYDMGVIWSPYSNLLLYGQTLDFELITNAQIRSQKKLKMALGSDWTPTGSKSVLEEVKLARNYILQNPNWFQNFGDKELYHMLTSGPAAIMNQEGRVGTLQTGAMASLVIASKLDPNPYTNLVRDVWARDINLVILDGRPLYGDERYLKDLVINQYETIPDYIGSLGDWVSDDGKIKHTDLTDNPLPTAPMSWENQEQKDDYLQRLGSWIAGHLESAFEWQDHCRWDENKGYVNQETANQTVREFANKTGLNLDRFRHIQALLAVSVMTQNRNVLDRQRGNLDARLRSFPALLSCNDSYSYNRLRNFVLENNRGEYFENLKNANQVNKVAQKLCLTFGITNCKFNN